MGKTVEFLFDVGSPASYLAWKRLPAVAARTGAAVDYQPVLLGGVFKATGNASPVQIPAKGAWLIKDLGRFADRHGVPFRTNANFPINTLKFMRVAAALRGDPRFMAYVDAVFDGMFADARNLADPAEIPPVLAQAGLSAEAFEALADDREARSRLKADTERAVARGVFGAPTFFVEGEMYFGQDRLDFVEAALAA